MDECGASHVTGSGPDDPKDTGVHLCIDLPDHSAGAHLCKCGLMWRTPERGLIGTPAKER